VDEYPGGGGEVAGTFDDFAEYTGCGHGFGGLDRGCLMGFGWAGKERGGGSGIGEFIDCGCRGCSTSQIAQMPSMISS